MAPAVELWFELASTYSYVGAERIVPLARAAGVTIVWRPFLLGPIFAAQQGLKSSPFNANPVRGEYMWRDLERLCARHGLPWRRPSVFPRPSILATRVALVGASHPWGPAFVHATYRANFAEDRDISSREVVADLLARAGAPVDATLAAAESPENKAALRDQTDAAARLGMFGAPNLVVNGELFFGQDRFEDAFAWLERPWLPPAPRT